MLRPVIVSGGFDDLRSRHVRFLDEASRLGPVHVALWPDARVHAVTGAPPAFPLEERRYFLQAIRYVADVGVTGDRGDPDDPPEGLPQVEPGTQPVWAVSEDEDNSVKRRNAASSGAEYHVVSRRLLSAFPDLAVPSEDRAECAAADGVRPSLSRAGERVVVTGCYDWLHTGHVRFFEQSAEFGELYVVVGHDENVRLLKGRKPMFSQQERLYMAGAIRYVRQALISTGSGWMDAAPEIERICPTIYLVNEDGDQSEKRDFCKAHGLRYVVLKRSPRPGLPARQSTALRGF